MTSTSPLAGSVQILAGCSSPSGKVDLVIGARDGEVWHKTLESKKEWRSLGRPWPASPSENASGWLRVTTSGPGRIQVFAHHRETQQTFHNSPEDEKWLGWTAQPLSADTAAVAEATVTDQHQFAVNTEGSLLHRGPDGSNWVDLGGHITGGTDHVAAVTSGDARCTLFAIWMGCAIMRRSVLEEGSPWELVEVLRADVGAYTLLRPQDFVSLTLRSSGLRERPGESGNPEWIAEGSQAKLIVEFPPQHIVETVLEGAETVSKARLAGPSSLHFTVTSQAIALSTQGVLLAMAELPLAVTPPLLGQASTLELPWGLLLALQATSHCDHRTAPALHADGVTEMWHTRVLNSGGSYASVRPIAARPLESPFHTKTPLGNHVGAIANAGADPRNDPMEVDRLILSACGAWFSGSGNWPDLDWTHRMAMARDYYVRVFKRGVLFPFGHRAAVVEITERRFDKTPALAGLYKTRALVVTEPSREYEADTLQARAFPFQRIEIGPRLVTPLDDPGTSTVFWPKQNGRATRFSVRGTAAGEVIEMELPLLFGESAQPELMEEIYARGVDGLGPTAFVGRFMPLAMKNGREPLEQSTQRVRSLTFGGQGIGESLGFYPKVRQLELELPAVNQLLGPMKALPATFSQELLDWTPSSPAPDVLLEFLEPRALNFGSANSGLIAAPNMTVSRLSRNLGPTVAKLPTNPSELFDASSTLLGIVPLTAIISSLTGQPVIKWEQGPNPTAILHWKETLSKTVDPFQGGKKCQVELTVKSSVVGGRPTITTSGHVKNFKLNIPSSSNALVILAFNEVMFKTETDGHLKTGFDIKSASLGGNLQFIQKLGKYLPNVGNSAPIVNVGPAQIQVAYAIAIPTPLSVGVFSLQNLLLQAGITLSLTNQPVTIDFSFGTRINPFLVTVMGFGGGGYLELGISAGGTESGLQRFIGGIEFGASISMDFIVASGEVHVFGGVVFAKHGSVIEITGYLRIGGRVRVLGLISVAIELTIALTYNATENVLHGEAKLVIAIDLTFWSTSIEIRCKKTFKGSDLTLTGAPSDLAIPSGYTVMEALGPQGSSFPWQDYCRAFAKE